MLENKIYMIIDKKRIKDKKFRMKMNKRGLFK